MKTIIYKDGTTKNVSDQSAWEYENDPDYERTTTPAHIAVDRLFTNGAGEKATRLVLMDADGRNLGGWGRQAVVDVLNEIWQTA